MSQFAMGCEDYLKNLRAHVVPEMVPFELVHPDNPSFINFDKRCMSLYGVDALSAIRQCSGYALIYDEWIKELATFIGSKKVLEVMSGTGALAATLRSHGVDIKCTDNRSWDVAQPDKCSPWCEVEELDCIEAVNKYGADVDFILMSWPPYDEPQANQVLLEMRKVNPNCRLIYIGESYGGCTADDEFFSNAVECEYPNISYLNINWFHDDVLIYR